MQGFPTWLNSTTPSPTPEETQAKARVLMKYTLEDEQFGGKEGSETVT